MTYYDTVESRCHKQLQPRIQMSQTTPPHLSTLIIDLYISLWLNNSMNMRRSQSSTTGIATPRRSIFPSNGGDAGWNLQPRHSSSSNFSSRATTTSSNNAVACAAGRSLLDRPRTTTTSSSSSTPNDIHMPDDLLLDATFSASAAQTPIRRRVSTDLTLKSCLSSSNLLHSSFSTTNINKSPSNNNGSSRTSQE